jgi:hypothetical protein
MSDGVADLAARDEANIALLALRRRPEPAAIEQFASAHSPMTLRKARFEVAIRASAPARRVRAARNKGATVLKVNGRDDR